MTNPLRTILIITLIDLAKQGFVFMVNNFDVQLLLEKKCT